MADMGVSFDGPPAAEESGTQRKKLVLLALLAVVSLVLALFVVPSLLGGDDAGSAAPIVKKSAKAGAKQSTKAKAKSKKPTKKATKKPAKFNGRVARDPFDPLYIPIAERPQPTVVPSAQPAVQPPGVPVTTPQPQPQPPTTAQPQPQPTPQPTTTGTGTPPPDQKANFTLIDVANEGNVARVTVLYNGLQYKDLAVGAKFGPKQELQVVSAVGTCASFLFTDKQFARCEGESMRLILM